MRKFPTESLQLDLGVQLRWSQSVDIREAQNELEETTSKAKCMFSRCGQNIQLLTPHQQPKPAGLNHVPHGACEGVGCARQLVVLAVSGRERDARGCVSVCSKLRASKPHNRVAKPSESHNIWFHVCADSRHLHVIVYIYIRTNVHDTCITDEKNDFTYDQQYVCVLPRGSFGVSSWRGVQKPAYQVLLRNIHESMRGFMLLWATIRSTPV